MNTVIMDYSNRNSVGLQRFCDEDKAALVSICIWRIAEYGLRCCVLALHSKRRAIRVGAQLHQSRGYGIADNGFANARVIFV